MSIDPQEVASFADLVSKMNSIDKGETVNGALLTKTLNAGTIYEVYGSFATANNVFTVGPEATATESIYIVGGENLTLGQVFTNSTNMFVTTEDLNFASFV